MGITRRQAGIGLSAGWFTALVGAEAAAPAPHRIDLHYHPIAPPWIQDESVVKSFGTEVLDIARRWTPAGALAEMDRNGVATVICSVSNPGIWFGNVAQSRRLARACNDYSAQLAQDHPGRFGLFAAIPLPDTEGSLAEIDYAYDVLKADGIGVFSSYDSKWLADPAFAPVMQALNRRKAVLYVHPAAPSCCRRLVPGIPASLVEYPADTTRTMFQWIKARASDQYPDLRLVFAHSGSFFMGGLGRWQFLSDAHPEFGLPRSFRQEVARLHFETSSSTDLVAMSALRAYVPNTHILFGTDSPFIGPMKPGIDELQKIGLPQADLLAIERDNALALLGRQPLTSKAAQ